MIKVAIIVPNYNKAKYIERCLVSAASQTYKNLEIIVVDDCSTDNSIEKIKKLQKKYPNIRLFCFKKNHGVSYARNYGASKTDADALTFLDSDDVYINSKKIENEVALYKKNTVVFSQWVPMSTNGDILECPIYSDNPFKNFAASKILSIDLPSFKQMRGYMIPAVVFHNLGGYSNSLNMYEDFDLQCKLAIIGKCRFLYTGEIGEAYRLNTGGLSSKNIDNVPKILGNIQKKYFSKLSFIQKCYYKKSESNLKFF